MSDKTEISWCDATFNPWWGCTKVSPACDHCYAERDAKRFAAGKVLWGVGAERRTFGDAHWQAPMKWAKTLPAKLGRRPRVFCASMADVFDNDAPDGARVRLFGLIKATPELDWLLLTKRIGNAARMMFAAGGYHDFGMGATRPLPNVWLGATVVNQEEADRDIPKLLAAPARVRFLSIEPMLGGIDLTNIQVRVGAGLDVFSALEYDGYPDDDVDFGTATLDWVIAGGESGPHARLAHPDWFRSLRDQCKAAGVPFHFKQWGEWWEVDSDGRDDETGDHRLIDVPSIEAGEWFDPKTDRLVASDGRVFASLDELPEETRCRHMTKLGKKAAGRLLDGLEHNGFPA